MISRHQGKLLKGFFTRNVSVHPELKTCNENCKKNPSKKFREKNIISPKK
jgi:hypothetical protein